jgi:hypothetical protein
MYVGFQRRRSVELATRLPATSTLQAPRVLPLLQPPHSSRNTRCLCMTKPIIIATLAPLCNASRPHERLLTGYDGPVLTYQFPCTNGGEVVCSGHYMYHQFNIHNSTFCSNTVFMCFVWISEKTAIISIYNINCLVFITEKVCVYCAVRTESLYN